MKEYYVKEYAVITYRVKAKSRTEVEQMIEDCIIEDKGENVAWNVTKHTIKEVKQ